MLKRKWARASIVLMGSGLTMLLIYLLLGEIVLCVFKIITSFLGMKKGRM